MRAHQGSLEIPNAAGSQTMGNTATSIDVVVCELCYYPRSDASLCAVGLASARSARRYGNGGKTMATGIAWRRHGSRRANTDWISSILVFVSDCAICMTRLLVIKHYYSTILANMRLTNSVGSLWRLTFLVLVSNRLFSLV